METEQTTTPEPPAEVCRDYNWTLQQIDLLTIKIQCLEQFVLQIVDKMEGFIDGRSKQ